MLHEKPDRAFNLLGLAHRARKLTFGMDATIKGLHRQKVRLVVLANDVSPNSIEKVRRAASQNRVPVIKLGSKSAFGHLFNRDEVGIIGILDASFASSIRNFGQQK